MSLLSQILLAATLAASCPNTVTENRTQLAWNQTDDQNMSVAQKRCVKWFPNSPCLKKFIKTGFNSYYVICGRK